jgi:hypothetical protein
MPVVVSANIDTFLRTANDGAAKESLSLAEVQPFVIAFKNVTVLTTGTPADVASVALPAWCTRYYVILTGSRCIAESAAGTLAGASFSLRDAASGGGNAASSAFNGPASASVMVSITGSPASGPPHTSATLYLNQGANSANAGTISVYAVIVPCL